MDVNGSPATCSPSLRRKVMKRRSRRPSKLFKGVLPFKNLTNKKVQERSQKKKWLHSADKIRNGVSFKVKYVSSVEVAYDQGAGAENQTEAIKACRRIMKQTKAKYQRPCTLNVSAGKMTVTSTEQNYHQDDSKIIMRHSTCRVAFSTVDPESPSLFCYVALVKGSKIALCHVFYCKTSRIGLELTFTCAQAFDYNYHAWVRKQSEDLDSSIFEPTIEPQDMTIPSLSVNGIVEQDIDEDDDQAVSFDVLLGGLSQPLGDGSYNQDYLDIVSTPAYNREKARLNRSGDSDYVEVYPVNESFSGLNFVNDTYIEVEA